MKKLLNYINNHVLVKLASLKMAAVIIRIIGGLLTSKAIAVLIGAEGMALIGNLRNFTKAFQAITVLGLYEVSVKHIASFKDDLVKLSKTVSTIFYVGFMSTVLLSIFCYFGATLINDIIFPTYNDYAHIIRIFAIALPFYALNMFSFSIMNGFSKYKTLIIINIIGQILGVSITLLLIYQNKIEGALVSVVIAEALMFLITLIGIINRRSLIPLIKVSRISWGYLKSMKTYSVMALFSAVILPLVALAIRSYIIENVGYKDAGFWEAMTRISHYYLMLVTALIALYILPRFTEIETVQEFKKEVFGFYKTVIPFFAMGLVIIYLLKSFIVPVVFSSEFQPVEALFFWQLLGDFVKILSLVIAYQFLAKKMFWHYVVTEIFLVIILYLTSIFFIDLYGVEGAVMGHFVSYLMYFAVILLIFGSSLFGVDVNKNRE
ncbi:O-antigen translocase [Mariniflexile ostreae]|uniref:O-antigen translocase n=1 Tax=Mariniflexile ostreae TaxID=1520892 RepID=A0ABV5FEX6_9FLAO